MTDMVPRCTVCGRPVFPTSPTMFRAAYYTTHPRCIRVPKLPRVPRDGRVAASRPDVADTAPDPGSASAFLGALLAGAQVLIVSQRDVVAEALLRLFRSLGVVALPAASAEQARGLVQALHVDLVLCDVSQLAFTEQSFIRQIREQAGGGTPVVLGLGATPAERALADSAGLDGFLPKPVGYGELAEAFRAVSRRRPDWLERHADRIRHRGESLRSKAARYLVDAEVTRLNAQAALARSQKRAARTARLSSPFRMPGARGGRPRYRPDLLG